MDANELKKDHVYVLTTDVVNPCADRRYRRRPNKLPVWTAGTRFLARVVSQDVQTSSYVKKCRRPSDALA